MSGPKDKKKEDGSYVDDVVDLGQKIADKDLQGIIDEAKILGEKIGDDVFDALHPENDETIELSEE